MGRYSRWVYIQRAKLAYLDTFKSFDQLVHKPTLNRVNKVHRVIVVVFRRHLDCVVVEFNHRPFCLSFGLAGEHPYPPTAA